MSYLHLIYLFHHVTKSNTWRGTADHYVGVATRKQQSVQIVHFHRDTVIKARQRKDRMGQCFVYLSSPRVWTMRNVLWIVARETIQSNSCFRSFSVSFIVSDFDVHRLVMHRLAYCMNWWQRLKPLEQEVETQGGRKGPFSINIKRREDPGISGRHTGLWTLFF